MCGRRLHPLLIACSQQLAGRPDAREQQRKSFSFINQASLTALCACSFQQLGLDADMTATLANLYDSIDNLEWPVGVLIEQANDGLDTFVGEVRRLCLNA